MSKNPSDRERMPGDTPKMEDFKRDRPKFVSDDDIVGRQIREAAMKETDPELRAALWEEYRRYKKGR